ncbi:HPr(Ser) kinase/phosphatase [Paramaledivibacter caminithermalis]|uniref:HPr kinase/phosphorylase n=1 Tax=Paramaledivibacter caminithermalis (strain DSM 15212 / CIP 107654 / DViRD3) TaxID=1121301 RepID=A0A1M6KV57_PARC5|nr:Hpr(Ser) kinase/phosphatase [Paramaledivibacter caminithermalis DSM 15212]
MLKKIAIKKLMKDLKLEVISNWKDDGREISTSEVNRVGLPLAGYFENYGFDRVQIIGKAEWSYFSGLCDKFKRARAKELMKRNIPCLVITRGLNVHAELLEEAEKNNIPIFGTNLPTSRFASRAISYLEHELAPTTTLHGVLIEVNGIGILIFGESGVGKSETALELVKRGHRLIADDAVEIKKVDEYTLIGTAPEIIKHFLEIRGIGILDVAKLYGMGAVRDKKTINLVVQLDTNESNVYDRLGIDEEYIEILGVNVSKLTIPVRPGRNLAVIIEAAARNHRQKEMGYNAAEELNIRLIKQNSSK